MPAELFWAPPLAPFGDEEAFLAPEPSRRTLVAGIAIVAALGAAALTYFFLASPGAKPSAETAQTSPIASSPTEVTQVQPAPTVAEPSPGAFGVVPSRDVPASLAAEASPQVAASVVTPQTNSTAQNPDDLVFLQRPGVNIRSGPSGTAPVLGTAPKGTQFTATGREGDWVQVENTRLKGWVNSQFLAPDKPQ
jgi:Bacterial SH3 domain